MKEFTAHQYTGSTDLLTAAVADVDPPRWDPHRSVRNPPTAVAREEFPVLWLPQSSVWMLKNSGSGAISLQLMMVRGEGMEDTMVVGTVVGWAKGLTPGLVHYGLVRFCIPWVWGRASGTRIVCSTE